MRTKHENIAELKGVAIRLRKGGASYPEIERQTGVTRSTLSGWLRPLVLPGVALAKIQQRKAEHLKEARLLSNIAHRRVRQEQVEQIRSQLQEKIANVPCDLFMKEMLLAMLYLGEGFKKQSLIGLGNSNPNILASFVELVRDVYQVDEKRFRCFLHLRNDQKEEEERFFWSRTLDIPEHSFRKTQFDKRTLGKKTWPGYHGVCVVYCYDANIEKRLTALQELLLSKILVRA